MSSKIEVEKLKGKKMVACTAVENPSFEITEPRKIDSFSLELGAEIEARSFRASKNTSFFLGSIDVHSSCAPKWSFQLSGPRFSKPWMFISKPQFVSFHSTIVEAFGPRKAMFFGRKRNRKRIRN